MWIQFTKKIKKKGVAIATYCGYIPQIISLQYCNDSKGNDAIYDQELICYKGKDCIYEEMEGLRFKINAKSFYQTNPEQVYKLYEVARNFAD